MVIGVALASAVGCSAGDEELKARFAAVARQGEGAILRVAELTDFEWDRLHVFPPYTAAERVESELGLAWPGLASTGIDHREGIALLVFVKDRSVVRFVEQPRSPGDFAQAGKPGGYTREDAVFAVQAVDRAEAWLVFVPLDAVRGE